ncbi:MAG: hypothetical protein OHK0013_26070 [Sandaracinaceae bacterium]
MPDERSSRASAPGHERTRLHIAGVRQPVLTRVARRRETGMTCVQELPFLRLESEVVDDRGRRARIARVALSVERDVPKLVIELAYDDRDDHDDDVGPPGAPFGAILEPARPVRRADQTIGYDERFRADPIDSLREPPITLREVLAETASQLVRPLEAAARCLARALSPTRPLRLA